jgi:hypothetical protein
MQAGNVALVEKRYADAIALYERHAVAHPGEAARCYTKIAEAYLRSNVVKTPVETEPGVILVSAPDDVAAERALRLA